MDFQALVEEVTRRVLLKLQELEATPCSPPCVPSAPASFPTLAPSALCFGKRVLVERDIIECKKNGVTQIHLKEKTIVTALAKDLAAKHGIALVNE